MPTMSQLRILVVGASIAGPTSAYWFAKAGADVTVIERFPRLRPGGQNIDIRTVGVSVMRKMPGMEEAVKASLAPIDGMSLVDNAGQPWGTFESTGDPDKQSLVSEYEITRDDLSRILVDLSKTHGARFVFGETILAMRYENGEDGPVTVEFANGLETKTYDLVVGCDGSHSKTRAMGFECAMRDHVESTGCFAAYFSAPKDLLEGSRIGKGLSAPGGRVFALGQDIRPNRNRVMLMGVHPQVDNPMQVSFQKAWRQGDNALKSFVSTTFRDMGWKGNEALQYIDEAEDFYANEWVRVRIPSYYNKRVVLVGDAAYGPGPTGVGTSLALAGGYILAGEISKHKGDLNAGLKAYNDTMKPIVDDMAQHSSLFKSVMAPQTSLGIWVRNHVFWVICRLVNGLSFLGGIFGNLFGSAFQANDKHKLDDYEF